MLEIAATAAPRGSPDPATMQAVCPLDWSARLSDPPVLALRPPRPTDCNLHRWTGTAARMVQPRLTHHYLVMHLGGPKRITRTGEGAALVREAPLGSLTIVPAGSMYDWATEGPIDFAHVYIDPARLARTAGEVFDRDPSRFALDSKVGIEDPLLSAAYSELLASAGRASHTTYLELLFDVLLARLVGTHGNLASVQARAPYALAPSRLRAVRDYVEANFAREIALDDLAAVAGLSRFHFSRAFHRATGVPPYVYVTHRRLTEAKRLLRETDRPVGEIAVACGYRSGAQFASIFRRTTGIPPSLYRARR